MGLQQVRWTMIGLLAAAAVLSVVGKEMNDRFIGWLAFVCFIVSVFLYMDWRRRVAAGRRAKVFASKSKTSETAKTDENSLSPDE